MSSTNKTTNYDLSQYIGSDKPTYLSDYNGDMLKIDTQMKANADNVALAISGVQTATTTANTANSTATTANTNANTAITNNATTQAELTAFKSMFNLSSIKNYGINDIDTSASPVAIDSVGFCDITLAKDSTGSIFKLYGEIRLFPHNSGSVEIVLPNTGLMVTDGDFYIHPVGMANFPTISNRWILCHVENNKITLQWLQEAGNVATNTVLFPCIYFNSDFGDSGDNS